MLPQKTGWLKDQGVFCNLCPRTWLSQKEDLAPWCCWHSSGPVSIYFFKGWWAVSSVLEGFIRKNFMRLQTYYFHTHRKWFGAATTNNTSIYEYHCCAVCIQSPLLSPAPEHFSTAGEIIVVIMVGGKELLWSLNCNELTQELFEAFFFASFPPTLLHIFKPKAFLS